MKTYINIKLATAFGCVMLLGGCSLDVDNKANVEAGKQLSTDEGIESLRTYMYSTVKPLVNETNLTEWGTDLYSSARSTNVNDYQAYKFTPETSDIASYYTNAYILINQANCVLKYAASKPKYVAEAKFLRCYAYFLLTQQFGAVPYITEYIDNLNKNYPRTPLKEVYDNVITELESIQNDANLPDEDHNGNVSKRAVKALLSKVCLAAGWDLGTKLSDAAKGTYTTEDVSYFKKAADYAVATIAGQQLTMSFEDKWSPKNEGNAEEIFSVQYDRANYPGDLLTGGNSRQNTYGSEYGDPRVSGLKKCNAELAQSVKGLYLFDEGDERFDATFMMTIYNYTPGAWGVTGYYAYYNASDEAKEKLNIACKYFPYWVDRETIDEYVAANKERFVRGESDALCHVAWYKKTDCAFWWFKENGDIDKIDIRDYDDYKKTNQAAVPPVKKFDDPNTAQVNAGSCGYRDIPVLHLSDIYLVAAEAYLMSGNDAKALEYINAVRTRAKAGTIASISDYKPHYDMPSSFGTLTLLDLLLDERARELYAETTRWMDLRRTRQLVRYALAFNEGVSAVSDMCNAQGEIKWLRPIPSSEISTNSGISEADQNPGY